MIVEIAARRAPISKKAYIVVDWAVPSTYIRGMYDEHGQFVWIDPDYCSDPLCIREAGHDGTHRDGRGTSWMPMTDEEYEEMEAWRNERL